MYGTRAVRLECMEHRALRGTLWFCRGAYIGGVGAVCMFVTARNMR